MTISKQRTKRDDQQWMLDLALNMRGRVQNFERDDQETPTRAHNYRMLPKQWRKKAEHDEALGRQAQAQGFDATACEHYDHAVEAYRMAQHPIFYDDNPIKLDLYGRLNEVVDRRSEVAPILSSVLRCRSMTVKQSHVCCIYCPIAEKLLV